MRRFAPPELVRFLVAIDQALSRPVDVIIIGGTAAALHYGVSRATQDVDTWTKVGADLAKAIHRAREETGLAVPFSQSAVADAPHDFESRLERTMCELEHLVIRVPEKHDLVLMKMLRGYEHDLEAIVELNAQTPLDLELLVDRYETEMGAAIIDPGRLRGNLLNLIERLFPDELAAVEKRLESGRRARKGR